MAVQAIALGVRSAHTIMKVRSRVLDVAQAGHLENMTIGFVIRDLEATAVDVIALRQLT
jgi:hypothetical protein